MKQETKHKNRAIGVDMEDTVMGFEWRPFFLDAITHQNLEKWRSSMVDVL